MVNTVKFSQFAIAPLTNSSTGIVGLESGVNIQSTRWPVWTTAGRPTPPFNGLLGVNSDLHQYEWYDGFAAQWFQIPDSGDIAALLARLAAHTVGDGASMIGLQNQSGVTNKTVQDLANAQFVVNVNNGSLQNAQSLGSLTTGIVKNTTGTGVLSISTPLTQIDNLSPVQGDILYHNGAAWVVLPPSTPGFILKTQGAGANPIWAVDIFSGTVTSFSSGDLSPLFTTSVANPTTTPALSFSLTNAGANTYFGNATGGSAAPSYTAAGALSKVDDANVTLTLGGSPTVALLASASLTLGWTGVLSLARGGTNKNITAVAGAVVWSDADSFELTAAGSSGQLFQSTGTTAPGWTTATYPATASTSGNVISSNGTNFVSSTLSSVMDAVFGNAQGDILYRNATDWVVLAPGTNGFFLQTGGPAANPAWSAGNSGTVTSVATNNGLTGGTITTTGTLGLAAIADHTLLANISGGSTFPSSTTLTALIDNAIGNTQGNILYRNASAWVVLAPGTSGQFLQSLGAGANIQWAPGDGAGTVTSVTFTGDGVFLSSTPSSAVTSSGTLTATMLTQTANTVLAGPTTGGAATPTFRSLVAADFPTNLTYTPAFSPGSGSFNTITYATQVGKYTQLGNIVFIAIAIELSAFVIGTASGNITINLPIAQGGAAVNEAAINIQNITLVGSPVANITGSTLFIFGNVSSTTPNILQASGLAANSVVRITGFYYTS